MIYRINASQTAAAILAVCAILNPFDVLEVEAGQYTNCHLGIKADDVTVRGILGPNGELPHFESVSLGTNAKGKPKLPPDFTWSAAWTGRGICVVKGKRSTIEHIEFSGAKSNNFNGAGIRHESEGLTVKGCVFHHNENGILGSEKDDPATPQREGGMVWIEGCHFYANGAGDGQSHNVYIGRAETCVFYNNVSEGALMGHLFKCRSQTTIIFKNIFRDGDGNPSYHCDIDGGRALIWANTFEKGNGSGNLGHMIHYYLWHDNAPNVLTVIGNRMNCQIDRVAGDFVFADERIETKVNKKTVYIGTGTITGRINENVAIFSPRLNAKGAPYPRTYGVKPWRAPESVVVGDGNVVVPLGKEPAPMPATPFVLTPDNLGYLLKMAA